MPYSDNLYSMGDDSESDGEGFADQLSPTDGYFASSSSSSHVVPNVPNILVSDPTLQQTPGSGAESKAREAEEERVSSNTRTSDDDYYNISPHTRPGNSREPSHSEQHRVSSTTPRQPRYHPTSAHTYLPSSASRTPFQSYPSQGRTPSVYSNAPPAYSPSPTTPISPTSQSTQPRSYNTFTSTMGVSDIVEQERLLGRDPESIGRPDDQEVGAIPQWGWRVRRRLRLPTWLSWKMLLVGLIVLVVSIGLLASAFRDGDHKKTIGADPVEQIPPGSEKEPVTEPITEPGTDEPVMAEPFQPSYCEDARYRFEDQILALNFDKNHNVTFIEDQHAHSGSNQLRVGGQVNVRRLDRGGDPRIVLEIATNDKDVLLDVFADEEAQAMKVSVPQKYDALDSSHRPCIEMRATIWVPEDAELGVLSLGVIHLDILLLDDLSLHVADYSRISSIIGDIRSASDRPMTYNNTELMQVDPDYTFVPARDSFVFDSRIIEVSTTSGTINGNWPLYDMLGLHTTSGDIRVSITPEEELAADPKPAVLSLSSVSGTLHATEPVHAADRIPRRNYLVDAKSTSGGIHGALAFGAGVQLKSTASDIALDLLPVVDAGAASPDNPAQLETATTSGSTAVRVLEPVFYGRSDSHGNARPLDCLQAVHKSASGDVGLQYPRAWEGYLEASTTAGQIKVRGRDVKIVKSVGNWPGSKVEARKGAGGPGSTIQVRTLTGNLDAVIGEK
ncbi:hypothetical protein GGR54DRAFT_641048 [Hypoxylon sp. NC1633]|nr:hypothetical protein GGR54DRAFT_641048 [Hypoxylon sp. NC1633]